jgi:hypothetical protein
MNTQSSHEIDLSHASESIKQHKRQRFWQIILPIGFFSLILIAGIVLIIIFGFNDDISIRQISDTAAIWLIAPTMLFALIAVLILGGIIYLVAKLIGILPTYTGMAQHYVGLIPIYAKKWSDKVVSPILTIESTNTRIRTFWSFLLRRSSK